MYVYHIDDVYGLSRGAAELANLQSDARGEGVDGGDRQALEKT